VVSGEAIGLSAKFQNQGSTSAVGTPLTGGNGGDAGGWAVVPNAYFATDIAPQWKFGLGINAPFGLKTDYDAGWAGRYQALETKVESVNINPSVAYQVNDKVSVGGGVSAMYMKGDLSKAIDFGSIQFALSSGAVGIPQNQDGGVQFDGSGWGYGWNLGALFQVTADTRVGVAFRSQVKEELSGQATFSGVPSAPLPLAASPQFSTTGAKTSITLPETASLSAFTQIDSKWSVMGDVTWTKWSSFNELRLKFGNGAPDSVTTENWKDSYRVSAGVSYQYSDRWKLRGGIAYDKSPVDDQFRTAAIPDNDRKWLAVGASYKVSGAGVIDFGYAHLFISDASINHAEPPAGGTLIGTYNGSVDILGVQYTHNF
jgi:long-chain fatty acid transport protein